MDRHDDVPEDAVIVEEDYENKLLSYYSDLYLNESNSVMGASKVRKVQATYSNATRFEVLEYLGTGESVRATARAFKITKFYTDVQRVQQKASYPFCFIGNMDEIPAYFDLVPSKVVSRKGAKDCRVITTGSEKRHVTVVLTVMADGRMPPPMVIFKGKRKLKLSNVADGMLVTVQQKAWMDSELMQVYLNKIWHPFIKK